MAGTVDPRGIPLGRLCLAAVAVAFGWLLLSLALDDGAASAAEAPPGGHAHPVLSIVQHTAAEVSAAAGAALDSAQEEGSPVAPSAPALEGAAAAVASVGHSAGDRVGGTVDALSKTADRAMAAVTDAVDALLGSAPTAVPPSPGDTAAGSPLPAEQEPPVVTADPLQMPPTLAPRAAVSHPPAGSEAMPDVPPGSPSPDPAALSGGSALITPSGPAGTAAEPPPGIAASGPSSRRSGMPDGTALPASPAFDPGSTPD